MCLLVLFLRHHALNNIVWGCIFLVGCYSIATNLGVDLESVTVIEVYLCPDASQPKCSSRRMLKTLVHRKLAASFIIVE